MKDGDGSKKYIAKNPKNVIIWKKGGAGNVAKKL